MYSAVPVEEGLVAEHGRELLGHALEHLLDGGGVAEEDGEHLQALGRSAMHAPILRVIINKKRLHRAAS